MLQSKNFILLFLLYTGISFACSVRILSDADLRNYYHIDAHISHPGTDACIRKIGNGTKVYILKQINDPSPREQFLLVREAIASTIGYTADINVNEVFFIPPTVAVHLKNYPNRAATLHAYISGTALEDKLPHGFPSYFSIHQRKIDLQSKWQSEWPVGKHQQGLNQSIIENMSLHKDLSSIVALDTFVGNTDRSLPNIFHDKQNNNFYGIDQAAAFEENLAQLANDRIKGLIKEGYFKTCDLQVIDGLHSYRKTLYKLLEKNTPSTIIQDIQTLWAHLASSESINNFEWMTHHLEIIKESHTSILELISLLEHNFPPLQSCN